MAREQPVGRWIDGQDPALRVGDDDCGSSCCENDVARVLARANRSSAPTDVRWSFDVKSTR